MKLIIAVDPGKATGISIFEWEGGNAKPNMICSCESQPKEFAPEIRKWLEYARSLERDVHVVCERFVINAQTVKNSQAPYSLEQIGVLKQCLRDYDIDEDVIAWQSPADAKKFFTNEGLKKLGFWHKGGGGHALDSIRHGLLYMVKRSWKPTELLT